MNKDEIFTLFENYSYKRFQSQVALFDQKQLNQFHVEDFLRDERRIVVSNANDIYQGIGSVRLFPVASDAFKMPCFFLRHFVGLASEGQPIYNEVIARLLHKHAHEMGFLVARQPVDNAYAIRSLVEHGFYYVCTEANFVGSFLNGSRALAQVGRVPDLESGDAIRPAEDGDLPEVVGIAEESHIENRYLYDDFFDVGEAKKMYARWLWESHINPNHWVWVYTSKGKVLGFITAIKNQRLNAIMPHQYGSLDYIAIRKGFGGKGMGSLLQLHAIRELVESGIQIIFVKTMGNNYKAIKLLHKFRFVLCGQNTLLHRRFPRTT